MNMHMAANRSFSDSETRRDAAWDCCCSAKASCSTLTPSLASSSRSSLGTIFFDVNDGNANHTNTYKHIQAIHTHTSSHTYMNKACTKTHRHRLKYEAHADTHANAQTHTHTQAHSVRRGDRGGGCVCKCLLVYICVRASVRVCVFDSLFVCV